MDEPTSALTAKEINELFRIIRQLRDEGCGIVYISHRLEELQHIVDRVTIMRDGQYITSMNFRTRRWIRSFPIWWAATSKKSSRAPDTGR